MKDFMLLLSEFGLPVAGAVVMAVFIYIILRYILDSVVGQTNTIKSIITQLDNRVRNMNNDMIKLDLQITHVLGLEPDEERIARANGKEDARRD
jgi:hypothetical protein|tara:strand:+ start:391 stop:672 length:282 start_codon:yes stop_codon:yes gene_type:complete